MDKKVHIWDLNQPQNAIRTFGAFENDIKHAKFDGENGLMFHGDGKDLKIWDMRYAALILIDTRVPNGPISTRNYSSDVTSLKFSCDPLEDTIIVTTGILTDEVIKLSADTVHFYNRNSSDLIKEMKLPSVPGPISCASLNPEKTKLVVASSLDQWLRVFDFKKDKEILVLKGYAEG
jgi:WD40 repeat protein